MAKKNNSTEATAAPADGNAPPQNVSLGPACGVLMIFGCVAVALTITVATFLLFGEQNKMASAALRTQLIPWVEQSQLSEIDRKRIVERLTELSTQIERGEIKDRQLSRVYTRVNRPTVLQWAPIEQTIAFADKDGEFSDSEREQLKSIADRLLQACAKFQVNMEDLGFLVQNLATQERGSGRLVLKPKITHADVISFMQRTQSMLDQRDFRLNEEKRYQSVSQVFDQMIDQALTTDDKLPY